ncbi:uncharacterized protein EI90DRAFT_3056050 [Cantharellus anzutake]|uniref:uncharacterized protein n=1 Tax=Cantharellus anzutake TaxID=1750568 RepID=UPI0019084336|nr:uncharacterized protein EI90DRAFT_3056050 [Cantharellus anzutake]KAF8331961.1 hypothetical protein EI90DRAFT_3056050 [Cantharellus anzutake]
MSPHSLSLSFILQMQIRLCHPQLSRTGQNQRERRFGPAKKSDFDGDLAPEYIFTPQNFTSARENKQDANQTFLRNFILWRELNFRFRSQAFGGRGVGSYFSFGGEVHGNQILTLRFGPFRHTKKSQKMSESHPKGKGM